jgi:hypothetical protein
MTAPKIVMPSQIVMRATASLIGYARNSRTHDERQIDVLCKSIVEYGFTNPILIDGDRGVIAGHGRIMAAEKLGLVEVPCIELRHLTNEQKRAYLILDNQSSLMSGWNEALLAQELADLSGVGIEATDLGFDSAEVDRLMETLGVDFGAKAEKDTLDGSTYTTKIQVPVYEPKGECPPVCDLFDNGKTKELVAEIDAAVLPAEVASFLRLAAERHTSFNFRNIAEYYAHADEKTQSLMERSALVIIDFNSAIENGFVRLTERLGQLAEKEGWNGAD